MKAIDEIRAMVKLAQEGLADRSGEYGINAPATRAPSTRIPVGGMKPLPLPRDYQDGGMKTMPLPRDYQDGGMKTMPLPRDYQDGGMKTMPLPTKDGPSLRKDVFQRMKELLDGAHRSVRGTLPIPILQRPNANRKKIDPLSGRPLLSREEIDKIMRKYMPHDKPSFGEIVRM